MSSLRDTASAKDDPRDGFGGPEPLTERLRALRDIGARVGSGLTVREICTLLSSELGRLFSFDRAAVAIDDPLAPEKVCDVWGEPFAGEDSSPTAGTGGAWAFALSGSHLTVDAPDAEGFSSHIAHPLAVRGRTIGAVRLASRQPGAFARLDAEVLALLAGYANAALESAERAERGERTRHELTVILDIAQFCAGITSAQELFASLPERVARLVGATRGVVATFDAHDSVVTCQGPGFNLPEEMIAQASFRAEQAQTGEFESTSVTRPVFVNDVATNRQFAHEFFSLWNVQAILCAPMRVKGSVVGLVYAFDKPGGFDDDDARLLAIAAAYGAEALSNAQLFEAVQAQAQRESLLNRITAAVRESLELDKILQTAVRMLGRSLDLCRCYVAFVDASRFQVRVEHEYRIPDIASTLGHFPMAAYGDKLLKSLEQGRALVVDNVATDPRVDPWRDRILTPLGVQSLMYVPVLQEGTLLAVIGLSQCRWERHWTAEEVTLAQAVADQVAVAMRQAQLFDQHRRAAEYRALVNRVTAAVRGSLDLDTMLETSVQELGRAMGVDRCYVLAPGPFPATLENALVRFEYARPGVASVKGIKMPVRNRAREGPVGMIEEPLVISDIRDNPRLVSRRKADLLALTETRALLSARAIYGDQVLAILELNQCDEARVWSTDEVDLIAEVAGQLAIGIHNALMFRRVTSSESQWNTTFNAMIDGLALLDTNGRVICLNDSMLRMCDLEDPQSAIGRSCYALLYGDDNDTPIQRVLSTNQRVQIERDIAARGVSLRESIDPIFDDAGTINALVVVVRDVTREREAERAIRYRNRQLAALNAIAAAATHTRDVKAIIEGAFARVIDVTGADAGAVLLVDEEGEQLDPVATHGGAARSMGLLGRDASSSLVRAVLAADTPLTLAELTVHTGERPSDDGDPPLRAGLVAPIRSRQQPLGVLEIAYTAERSFSANERQLLAVAGQQIGVAVENARLIANLQQALDRVKEANRVKDEFLAMVSHELRTPLTAIQGWSEVLEDPDTSPEETAEGIAIIRHASASLTQLISDLLDMSRIEHRVLRLEIERIDPNHPILAAILTVRHLADSKGVTIVADLDDTVPIVNADPGRMQQIIWNLLVNATKFTPAGGEIRVTSRSLESNAIEIDVTDNGIGIPPDFLPHVFERFRQADGSTTRQYGGLGLGLSLVKSLVEAHQGTVHVHSEGRGLGATFTVRLPSAP
jgi:PAS domain S-box-containing protein